MVVRSRRIVRVALTVAALLAIAACVTWVFFVRPNASTVRSVVLISIDTCRADHLSCYGYFIDFYMNSNGFQLDSGVFL